MPSDIYLSTNVDKFLAYIKYLCKIFNYMLKNIKSTKQLLFENVQKLEPKTTINEGFLQEELEKELNPINERIAKRLFKAGKVIYIQYTKALNGILDSEHNLFMLSRRGADAAMNIYTGGLKPDQLGFDFFKDKLQERAPSFPLQYYTLFSDEFKIISNGKPISDQDVEDAKMKPMQESNSLNFNDLKGFENYSQQEKDLFGTVLGMVQNDSRMKEIFPDGANLEKIAQKFYANSKHNIYDAIKEYAGTATNPVKLYNGIMSYLIK